MTFLSTWPDWVIEALAMSLAAIIGALLGVLGRRAGLSWWKAIPAVLLIVTYPIATQILVPQVRGKSGAACAELSSDAVAFNVKQDGKPAAPATILNFEKVDCAGNTVVFDATTAVSVNEFDLLEYALVANYESKLCGIATIAAFTGSGGEISVDYHFGNGTMRKLAVSCKSGS